MITIENNPIEMNKIKQKYQENRIGSIILTILDKNQENYNYSSIDALSFEIDLRIALVEASLDLYKSDMEFAIFRKTKCNNAFWIRKQNGGFLLRDDVKPSDAVLDIYKSSRLYATECATAMVIVYYKALLKVFEENDFNQLFKDIYLMNWHYIDKKIADIGYLQKTTYYLPGDRRYFKNPDVSLETPEWQGENTIDLGNDRYYGHGLGIYNQKHIIDILNQERKKDATQSAYLMDTVGRPNFNMLFQLKNRRN